MFPTYDASRGLTSVARIAAHVATCTAYISYIINSYKRDDDAQSHAIICQLRL